MKRIEQSRIDQNRIKWKEYSRLPKIEQKKLKINIRHESEYTKGICKNKSF